MTKKSEIGIAGEEAGAKYLKSIGYKVLERNYRQKFGEIDIVALDSKKILVLFEVKTVAGEDPMFTSEDQMTKQKTFKTRRIAEFYANNHESLSKKGWRIDLLAIKIVGDKYRIKHYENI
ncbi:MAG: hypothetical protein A3B23_01875 [Candidatus Colwellbacteria bacterium RIFCSPLOWO2_01_FULL_48_10]|uniref:UPF0102 protein A3B23_01875 n=1 Tax=Candidatus Colwellbacteria bacterium RIFCSPLOWO2_01_FULL_48_10 TaxID=1797690 RepID=A0A1G1Z702_9BACT|nr:MAG: hypothetical protein A3B23_01875 [Candidatus Colwellbacteria bacterium RIFCSPLOWO2_01_FULL_48_10]